MRQRSSTLPIPTCSIQDESTHENAIQFAEFPLLILTGSDGKEITIGANKMIAIKDDKANLKYVEHSGKALEAGRLNLEDLRVKAGYCGLKVLMSDNANGRSANSTATEAEIENIDANSELKVASDNFVDSVNYALWLYELYLGTVSEKQATTSPSRWVYSVCSRCQRDCKC